MHIKQYFPSREIYSCLTSHWIKMSKYGWEALSIKC